MRTILVLLACYHGTNALVMLAFSRAWYDLVPGVAETGPYNGHFVRDIGLAFAAAAVALVFAARRSRHSVELLAAASVFLAGHATLHVLEWLHGSASATEMARDAIAILLPGYLPLVLLGLASRRNPERNPA